MSTAFKELTGSPVESYDSYGMKAERQLICVWSERDALVQEILGPGFRTGSLTPISYPGVPTATAASVKVEPLTDDMIEQSMS
ncbi:MAG: hypothetical protein ACWGMZ_04635, partial [Thermoguttaceae bacterium]